MGMQKEKLFNLQGSELAVVSTKFVSLVNQSAYYDYKGWFIGRFYVQSTSE
jgi:hypothetical protein